MAPLLARRSRRRLHGPGRARGTGARRLLSTHHGRDVHVVGVRGLFILFQVHVLDAHASPDFLRLDSLRGSLRSLALAGARAAGAHAARRFVIVSRSLRLFALRRRHRGPFRSNLACGSLNAASDGNHHLCSLARRASKFFIGKRPPTASRRGDEGICVLSGDRGVRVTDRSPLPLGERDPDSFDPTCPPSVSSPRRRRATPPLRRTAGASSERTGHLVPDDWVHFR